jgi:AcrR family transcriptional regulator
MDGRGMAKRQKSPDRKEHIVSETCTLILEYGLSGTTTARIAARVGVTEAALYRHFKNRHEILLAVFEQVAIRFLGVLISDEENVPDYIRSISQALYRYLMSHPDDAKLIYEFICAPPAESLRSKLQNRLMEVLVFLEQLLSKGISQGSIRPDINPRRIAWELFGLGSAISFAAMLDFQEELSEDLAMTSLEEFVGRIRAD